MIEAITNLPIWLWVIAVFGLLIFFGDRKLWEYEVKFLFKPGVGRGEIEFEALKKKGTSVEVKFDLEEASRNVPIEIFINDSLVFTIPKNKNTSARLFLEKNIDIGKPNEGDTVSVRINGQEAFSGQLVKD